MLVHTNVVRSWRVTFGVLTPWIVACGATPDSGASAEPAHDAAPSPKPPTRDAGSTRLAGDAAAQGFGDAALATGEDPADAFTGTLMGCAESTARAQQVPVDLYFILDTSGSMNDLVGPGQSKWDAVLAALTTFIDDPASSGLAVGLQYFPVPAGGVPASCSSDDDCGDVGPCLLGLCDDGNQDPCAGDDDCDEGAACLPVGACSNDTNTLCDAFGQSCGADDNGFDLGRCPGPLATSYCAYGDSCSPDDYADAAVPIAALPEAASAVVASLRSRMPEGDTPTEAALEGAIRAASAHATANPGHTVAAVLATDGVPDEDGDGSGGACTSIDTATANAQVARIAAAGLVGTPGVETFAIGVFTPDDIGAGTATLAAIASSGGTAVPFIVDTSDGANVEQQFVSALAQIRGMALPCAFALPSAPSGGSLDFGRVNVDTSSGGGPPTALLYVESPATCDAAGGWYYDVDPAEGGTPAKIDLCPATCSSLRDDPSAVVDVVVGCETILR